MKLHKDHKLLLIDDEESLKKENITIEDSMKEFDNNIQKLNKLKELVENEMTKIDKAYETADKETTKSYEIKREKLNKEENDLKEKLKTEVTKIKEKLEISLSEINNLAKICEKIIKGVKELENEEKNLNKTLSYVSKINKSEKKMRNLFQELMKNMKISYVEEESKIKYEEYYFNGIPIPQNIEFKEIRNNSFKVFWNIENIEKLNIDNKEIKYKIEIRKENEKFNQINAENNTNYLIDNLDKNTSYEIRICSVYKDIISNWSKTYKIKSKNLNIDSIILVELEKGNEYVNKLYEWSGYNEFELIYRATRDGSDSNIFHNKCDNQGPTICLVQNDKGNIFGGFTSISWENSGSYKYADNCFLFTLTNIHNTSPTKFPNTDSSKSVQLSSSYGPIFGGMELCISNNFLNNSDSLSYFGEYYYKDILGKGHSIFSGEENNKYFKIKELEVFKLRCILSLI